MPASAESQASVVKGASYLGEIEARFQVSLSLVPLVVFSQDRKLRYTWVMNPTPGFTEEAVVGRTDEELLGAGVAAPLAALKRKVLRTGRGCRREIHLTTAGQRAVYDLILEPVRNPRGQVTGITGAAMDLSERRQMEARMQQLTRGILAAREQERAQVSAALHHDVGSLTVGISALLDAVEEDVRAHKRREALHGLRRIRRLFTASVSNLKAVAGHLRPPELDVIGTRGAVRQLINKLRHHRATRITFSETLGKARLPGEAAAILYRVAQEALTNALRHARPRHVNVELGSSGTEVTLAVRDDGTGLQRASGIRAGGPSMGLQITEELVVSAGGRFTIEPVQPQGTLVRVVLPLPAAPTARGSGGSYPPRPAGTKRRRGDVRRSTTRSP